MRFVFISFHPAPLSLSCTYNRDPHRCGQSNVGIHVFLSVLTQHMFTDGFRSRTTNDQKPSYTHTHEHTDIKHMLFNVCARNIVFVVLPVPHYSCSWFVRCAFLFLTCMQLCVRRPQLINKL